MYTNGKKLQKNDGKTIENPRINRKWNARTKYLNAARNPLIKDTTRGKRFKCFYDSYLKTKEEIVG